MVSMNKYALIGHHLNHSMSPFIHKKLFYLSGIPNFTYEIIDIAFEDLNNNLNILRQFNGLNVTIPYKNKIISMIDNMSESALRYNSVNCIVNNSGILTGYNTDCNGFLRSVKLLPLGGNVLLLGCGGVGRMIAIEALLHSAKLTIAIIPKNMQMTNCFIDDVMCKCSDSSSVKICHISEIRGQFDLLVNATPVGMFPKVDVCAVTDEIINNCQNFFDVIYNPTETLLMKKARSLGRTVVGGVSMLVYQAVKSHELWYGGKFETEDISKIILDVKNELNKINFKQ